jgi:GrpB-like predicted nucleotidyltransferase (UPF0157 family)
MVEIVAYRPEWPGEFDQIAGELRAALGDLALRIDHIGSTSVPGLAAKDIIDVQVTVAALEPYELLQAAFDAAGYSLRPEIVQDHRPPGARGPESDWEKRMARKPPAQRATNVHVRVAGRPNQRYALLFCDYLRACPAAAAAYAEVKRQLACYHSDDIQAYVTIKDPVCDVIMSAAEEWAAARGWRAGGSGPDDLLTCTTPMPGTGS